MQKIESAKKHIPQFRDDVARRVVSLELSRIETDLGVYDVMSECKIQSEDFFKIANVFTNLWSKLSAAEKKVNSVLNKLKEEIFDKLIIFGEQPISEGEKIALAGGDFEIMIGRVLPILRDVFDVVEIITLVSRLRPNPSHEQSSIASVSLQQEVPVL